MSLKSFDDFCAKIVNNDPIPQKDIFDERQTIVRAQLTTRALWLFVITSGINLLVMECGPQWCESYVLSTALFGTIAYLYWVCANARRGSLFGINGTATVSSQIGFLFGDAVILPIAIMTDEDNSDFLEHLFILPNLRGRRYSSQGQSRSQCHCRRRSSMTEQAGRS